MEKAARRNPFVLVALVALLAVPAADVQAATRMPIGFFDDSSFRFSAARAENLAGAAAAGASVIHTTANWSIDRADAALDTVERRRPGVPARRSRRARLLVGDSGLARDDQRHRDAEVGERQQDAEPPADAALRPDDVHEDARDAVQRPHGSRHGRALVGLERAEHRALPRAAVLGQEDRRPGELREALQGGVRGHQGRQPACEGRDRRDVGAWPRQAAQRASAAASRRARSRSCSAR